jgi:hypothetical protein
MKGNTHILAFAAEIDGTVHPTALFKFTGTDVSWWDWHHPSNGHTIVFDNSSLPLNKSVPLSQGKVFRLVKDQHRSRHASGECHRAITASGQEKEYVVKSKSVPISKIVTWENFASIGVPLVGPFFQNMAAGLWHRVKRREILRTEDFDGRGGVYLHAYICERNHVDELIQRWGRTITRHWTAGRGPIRLVVLAE